MDILLFLPAIAAGFASFHFTTHPKSSIRKKMPNIKVHRFQIFPSLKIHLPDKTIHFHHWLNFSIILVFSGITGNVIESIFLKGFLTGGILQGLTIPNGRKILYDN